MHTSARRISFIVFMFLFIALIATCNNSSNNTQLYSNVTATYQGKYTPIVARAITWEQTADPSKCALHMQITNKDRYTEIKQYEVRIYDKNNNLIDVGAMTFKMVSTIKNNRQTFTPEPEILNPRKGLPVELSLIFPSNVAFYNAPSSTTFPRIPEHRIEFVILDMQQSLLNR